MALNKKRVESQIHLWVFLVVALVSFGGLVWLSVEKGGLIKFTGNLILQTSDIIPFECGWGSNSCKYLIKLKYFYNNVVKESIYTRCDNTLGVSFTVYSTGFRAYSWTTSPATIILGRCYRDLYEFYAIKKPSEQVLTFEDCLNSNEKILADSFNEIGLSAPDFGTYTFCISRGDEYYKLWFQEISESNYKILWSELLSSLKSTPSPTLTTFKNQLLSIPGRIEAEDFVMGGSGVAYYDADANNNGGAYRPDEAVDIGSDNQASNKNFVGWIDNNEWLNYLVDVKQDGDYDLKINVASPNDYGLFGLYVDNTFLNQFGVPNTNGWNTWTPVTKSGIRLAKGKHTLLFKVISRGFNIDYFEFTLPGQPLSTPTPTPTPTPTSTPPPFDMQKCIDGCISPPGKASKIDECSSLCGDGMTKAILKCNANCLKLGTKTCKGECNKQKEASGK